MRTVEDSSILVRHLGADVRLCRLTSQNIHIDAVRAENKCRTCFHLGNHLDSMSSVCKREHREVEASVSGSRTGHGVGISLHTIHIERNHLVSRTAHGIRDADGR